MNVAIYTRVSTEDQKEKGFSLQDQERRLRQHCKQNGKSVVAHYQDNCSGKNFNRPQFQQMLTDIKSGVIKIKELWIVRYDRFARNIKASLTMIDQLKSLGVEFRTVEQSYDTSVPEGLVMHVMNMVMPQIENERRGLNTKQGMRQALREGKWVWKAPKGYINNVQAKTIEIGGDAQFIKKAFLEVSKNNKPIDNIRKELNQEGFKCSKQQFYNLLRNVFYTGRIKIEEWREEPEEIVIGNHPAIVTIELFQKVQDILNGKTKRQNKQALSKKFPLRGYLICNCCGNNLTASTSSGRSKKYSYYHCQNGCKERYSVSEVEDTFIEYLNELEISAEIEELYTLIIRDVFTKKGKTKEANIKNLNQELNHILLSIENLDIKFIDNRIAVSDYNRMITTLKNKESLVKQKLNLVESESSELEVYLESNLSLLSNIGHHYEHGSFETKQSIVGSIFPEKLIFNGKNYRTTRLNSFVTWITNNHKGFKSITKKKAAKNGGLSNWAPPLGLEPRTL
ncbi:recombinase family protein [Flagellimonas marinaquae]